MPLYRKAFIFIALVIMAGCRPLDPLIIPSVETVTIIEARISNSFDFESNSYNGSVKIDDPEKIEKIVDYLKQINSDMRTATTTDPTPTHTIILSDTENVNLVIFLGTNWIGGRNNVKGDASTNRQRILSDTKRKEFIGLLGVDNYRF
jgi:hypothetical protein